MEKDDEDNVDDSVDEKPDATGQNDRFRPYATATRETPLLHALLKPCVSFLSPLIAILYRCRWFLSLPLRTRILPKCVPTVPYFSWILNMTIGELLLLVPWIVLFLLSYHATFTVPNVDSSGVFASYTIFLTFLTANKSNSLFSFLLGIPYERMVELHHVSSVVSIALGVFHGIAAYGYDQDSEYSALYEDSKNWLRFLVDGRVNWSGLLTLVSMILLVVLSFFCVIRHYAYQLWLSSHIVLAITVLVGLFLHDVGTAFFVTVWWVVDLAFRYLYQASFNCKVQARLRKIKTTDAGREPALEISFPKEKFDYNPGQFVRIAVPALSMFEFHPISISSAPHEETVTLHVRALGNWTNRLVALEQDTTTILVEGPYGAPSVDLENDEQYQSVLLISGGIGVTPCQSIGKSLVYQQQAQGRKLSNLKFVWVVRNLCMVHEMPPLDMDEIMQEKSDTVQVDVFCTRSSGDDVGDNSSALYTVHQGRPDMDAIFNDMKAQAMQRGESYVAVIGCGPQTLMESVQQACQRHSQAVVGCGGDGVFFDLHTERFEY